MASKVRSFLLLVVIAALLSLSLSFFLRSVERFWGEAERTEKNGPSVVDVWHPVLGQTAAVLHCCTSGFSGSM